MDRSVGNGLGFHLAQLDGRFPHYDHKWDSNFDAHLTFHSSILSNGNDPLISDERVCRRMRFTACLVTDLTNRRMDEHN
jgi:hypothetical protein